MKVEISRTTALEAATLLAPVVLVGGRAIVERATGIQIDTNQIVRDVAGLEGFVAIPVALVTGMAKDLIVARKKARRQ